jgi:hypothetical protein
MPRVAKARRLKRQARLERQRAWLAKFWGSTWGEQQRAFLLTLQLKRGMPRLLRRMVIKARIARGARPIQAFYEGPARIQWRGGDVISPMEFPRI